MSRRPLRVGAIAFALIAILTAGALASVVQQGNLRVTVLSQVLPFKLPRDHDAPIAVFVSGHVQSVDGAVPPQLQRLQIEINRHGLLQSRGLPTCRIPQVRASSTQRALARCAPALIGSGQFWAHIVLPDQPAYPTRGRLLIFNGREGKQKLLIASIYATNPFSTSFVIPFRFTHLRHGPYGTRLDASFPQALGNWGFVDRIKLTLRRRYQFAGRQLSYFNAACPALPGAITATYPLARVNFDFAGGSNIQAGVTKACRVKP